jgi:hypothetical protein
LHIRRHRGNWVVFRDRYPGEEQVGSFPSKMEAQRFAFDYHAGMKRR